jgi:hypothetical protein
MLPPFSASIFCFPSILLLFVAFPGQRDRKWGSVSHPQMQNKTTAFQKRKGKKKKQTKNRILKKKIKWTVV